MSVNKWIFSAYLQSERCKIALSSTAVSYPSIWWRWQRSNTILTWWLEQAALPVRVRVGRDTFKHHCGRSIHQRSIHYVRMTSDPTHVGSGAIYVAILCHRFAGPNLRNCLSPNKPLYRQYEPSFKSKVRCVVNAAFSKYLPKWKLHMKKKQYYRIHLPYPAVVCITPFGFPVDPDV